MVGNKEPVSLPTEVNEVLKPYHDLQQFLVYPPQCVKHEKAKVLYDKLAKEFFKIEKDIPLLNDYEERKLALAIEESKIIIKLKIIPLQSLVHELQKMEQEAYPETVDPNLFNQKLLQYKKEYEQLSGEIKKMQSEFIDSHYELPELKRFLSQLKTIERHLEASENFNGVEHLKRVEAPIRKEINAGLIFKLYNFDSIKKDFEQFKLNVETSLQDHEKLKAQTQQQIIQDKVANINQKLEQMSSMQSVMPEDNQNELMAQLHDIMGEPQRPIQYDPLIKLKDLEKIDKEVEIKFSKISECVKDYLLAEKARRDPKAQQLKSDFPPITTDATETSDYSTPSKIQLDEAISAYNKKLDDLFNNKSPEAVLGIDYEKERTELAAAKNRIENLKEKIKQEEQEQLKICELTSQKSAYLEALINSLESIDKNLKKEINRLEKKHPDKNKSIEILKEISQQLVKEMNEFKKLKFRADRGISTPEDDVEFDIVLGNRKSDASVNLSNALSNDKISALTLIDQRALIRFINKHVIRPLTQYFYGEDAIKTSRFTSKSERVALNIKDELQQLKLIRKNDEPIKPANLKS